MKNTILITGGAGFIGSNFVLDWIDSESATVINLDKLTYAGNPANLASLDGNSRHIFVRGDIGDSALVDKILAAGAFSTMIARRMRLVAMSVAALTAIGLSAGTLLSMPLLLNHGKNMRTALSRHQDILRNAGNPEWEPRLAEVTAWRGKPGQEDPATVEGYPHADERIRHYSSRLLPSAGPVAK